MNIEDIKNTLDLISEEEKKLFLGNKKIKELIINNTAELLLFTKEREIYEVLYLLDKEGISILQNSIDLTNFLTQFIKSGIEYSHVFFENNEIFNLFYRNKFLLLKNASFFSYESAMIFILKMKIENCIFLLDFIKALNNDVQLKVLKNVKLEENEIVSIIPNLHEESINYLLEFNKNPYFLDKLTDENFYNLSQKKININSKLSANLTNKLFSSMDVNFYRSIINNFSKKNDVSKIEEKRCEFVDSFILDYDKNEKILNIHKKLLDNTYEPCILNLIEEVYTFSKTEEKQAIYKKISSLISNNTTDDILTFFKEESLSLIKDMIIDYHFNDYPHTVHVDIRLLLKYNEEQNYTILTAEKKELYTKIMETSSLNYDEIIKLHNELKTLNISNLLYEDIRKSKNMAYTNILDSIVSERDKEKIYNSDLSNKYGVDVLSLEGEPFYALVRSTRTLISSNCDRLLEDDYDFRSFSLISDESLITYRKPTSYFTLVYTEFNINNVLHTFPTDSFSYYSHDDHIKGGRPTKRSNQIHNANDLISLSCSYNEILLLQKGESSFVKENPKISYILCYDEIETPIIEAAKKLSLGILLINRKKYKTKLNINGKSSFDYDYLGDNDPDTYQCNNDNPRRSK